MAFEYQMKSIDTSLVSNDKSLKQMDECVCALQAVVNLLARDNTALKLKMSHWKTAREAVACRFQASWQACIVGVMFFRSYEN